MMVFDPEDPFPRTALSPEMYVSAKQHAALVDAWLGLRVQKVEQSLRDPGDGEERWLGREAGVFLTPYVELRAWLEELGVTEGECVVDLGAGYGRLGFVMARHFPQSRFLGFELVPERVAEGKSALLRFGAARAELEVANLAHHSWRPPEADIYFIYDFGTKRAIGKTLADLREISKKRGIRVVGRGRAVRDLIEREHPWLSSVHLPMHHAHYSIYRSFG